MHACSDESRSMNDCFMNRMELLLLLLPFIRVFTRNYNTIQTRMQSSIHFTVHIIFCPH